MRPSLATRWIYYFSATPSIISYIPYERIVLHRVHALGICTLFMSIYNRIVQTSIKLRPDFAIAHGNLGSCHYDRGDIDAAIRSFKYAIQLEPNFPDAYNNLGNALKDSGDLDEAIQCYRAALRLKPDHPHAYNNLG